MTPLEALENYFGYHSFRPGQEEIIRTILAGRNVLAVLPTGAGKSLCYQIPAIISDGLSIVISPLIALMKDQVDSLNKKNKIAAYLNSTLDYREEQKVLFDVGENKFKLLYVSPEKLNNVNFIEQLKKIKPQRIFVDEAHCISEWGMDFRPSYRRIKDISEILGIENISAFTATATPEVRKDILEQLNLKDPKIFISGFERENLYLNVIRTKHKKETVLQLLNRYGTPAIIYASTRRSAESIDKFLKANKVKSSYYHAGLTNELRRIIQDDFLNERIDVICATNAFGMGIDKANIRLVTHYNMPGSIENYYQEIGRAGRDGKPAHAYLLFSENDVGIHEYFIDSAKPGRETVEKVYNLLNGFAGVAEGGKYEKDIPLDNELKQFFHINGIKSNELNSSLNILSESGFLEVFPNRELSAKIKILLSPLEVKNYVQKLALGLDKDILLQFVKIYSGSVFQSEVSVNPAHLSKVLDVSEEKLLEHFQLLFEKGIIDFSLPKASHLIRFKTTRVHPEFLKLDYEKAEKAYKHSRAKLDSMLAYVFSNECRFRFVLNYFGENVENYSCGRCDNCLKKKETYDGSQYLGEIILRAINESITGLSNTQLVKILRGKSRKSDERNFSVFGICKHYSEEEIKDTVNLLTSKSLIKNFENVLILTDRGKEKLAETQDEEQAKPRDNKDYERKLELFNLLRNIRAQAAKKFYQTPQLICRDETLRKISEAEPTSVIQLFSIKGVNERMVNKVGEEFVEAIKNFKQEKESEKITQDIPTNLRQILELIEKGYSLTEISSLMRLPEAVISIQIETLIKYKKELDISKLIPAERIMKIKNLIESGFGDLKELKSELPHDYTYAELRVVKAKYEANDELSF